MRKAISIPTYLANLTPLTQEEKFSQLSGMYSNNLLLTLKKRKRKNQTRKKSSSQKIAIYAQINSLKEEAMPRECSNVATLIATHVCSKL